MKKGNLRNITVNNKTYKWIVEKKTYHIEIRIYDESKKMYRVHFNDLFTDKYDGYEDKGDWNGIKPEMVRIYIKNNNL